jgi:hypothetical protein
MMIKIMLIIIIITTTTTTTMMNTATMSLLLKFSPEFLGAFAKL